MSNAAETFHLSSDPFPLFICPSLRFELLLRWFVWIVAALMTKMYVHMHVTFYFIFSFIL